MIIAQVPALSRRYTGRLPISATKKANLLDLCRLNIVPAKHNHFYQAIPSSSTAPDCLPQPDITEDVDTDDG